MNNFLIISLMLLLIAYLFLGISEGIIISSNMKSNTLIVGKWFYNTSSYNLVQDIPNANKKSDWICINLNKANSYDRMLEIAQHEIGHQIYKDLTIKNNQTYSPEQSEIFAEICENNWTECKEFKGSKK